MRRLLIIGGGPAGNAAALAAIDHGCNSVSIVERESFGGTCTNRGCIPTKFLLSRSVAGPETGAAAPAWARLVAHKNALVKGLAKSIETRLAAAGVEIHRGTASFVAPHEVRVARISGGESTIEAEQVVIATGSVPAGLPGSPRDGERVITSDDALDLSSLPPSIAVIGSGAVGAEFSTIFARLGVKVDIIEATDRLFPAEDPDVDRLFRAVYERLGVAVHVGDPVETIELRPQGVAVVLRSGAVVEAAKALVAIGRTLGTSGLGLDRAGVTLDARGGVVVGGDLRTSAEHVFAAGDATGRVLLAHAASFMGGVAARSALGLTPGKVPYDSIPWATFTSPEVASVGLTLEAATRRGLASKADTVPLMDNVKARIDRTTEGFVKVVSERDGGRLLGATIVGPHASDMIHSLALAVHQGMTVSDLQGFTFIHPSLSESIGDLVMSMR